MIRIKVIAVCDRCRKEIPRGEPVGSFARAWRLGNDPEGELEVQGQKESNAMHFCEGCMKELWGIIAGEKTEEPEVPEEQTCEELQEEVQEEQPEAQGSEEQGSEEQGEPAKRKRKKWTLEEEMLLMQKWRDGAKNTELAEEFGVSHQVIGKRITACLERGL